MTDCKTQIGTISQSSTGFLHTCQPQFKNRGDLTPTNVKPCASDVIPRIIHARGWRLLQRRRLHGGDAAFVSAKKTKTILRPFFCSRVLRLQSARPVTLCAAYRCPRLFVSRRRPFTPRFMTWAIRWKGSLTSTGAGETMPRIRYNIVCLHNPAGL